MLDYIAAAFALWLALDLLLVVLFGGRRGGHRIIDEVRDKEPQLGNPVH